MLTFVVKSWLCWVSGHALVIVSIGGHGHQISLGGMVFMCNVFFFHVCLNIVFNFAIS